MKRQYSIYDVRTKLYDDNWSSPNDETAIRTLTTGVNKPGEHTLFNYPEDFALFYMGEYDPESGKHIDQVPPILVRQCQHMVEKEAASFEMTNGIDEAIRSGTSAVPAVMAAIKRASSK